MKAKVVRGSGFRGVLDYIHEKGDAEKVGGNMSGTTPKELASEFGITKKLRPDCKNPVWHCSLALPEGDRLTSEKWGELANDFMKEMGMDPANFLFNVQRHSDTEHDHIHIVASRIGLDSSLWHGQKDVLAAIEATQALEKKHGLTITTGYDPEHKKERKSLTAAEINMSIRTETKPPRMICQEAIDSVLQSKAVISAPEFIKRLEALGVRAVPSVATTGTMNGFSFESEGVSFTGSKLGEGYKWAKLQLKGVEYVKNRDFEELADAKRSAAARATDTASTRPEQPETGSSNQPGAGLEPVAGVGSGASAADTASTRQERPEAGRDSRSSQELGSVAPVSSRPGGRVVESIGADAGIAGLSSKVALDIRSDQRSAEAHAGDFEPGNKPASVRGDAVEGVRNEHSARGSDSESGRTDAEHSGGGGGDGKTQRATEGAGRVSREFSSINEGHGKRVDGRNVQSPPATLADTVADVGRGSVGGAPGRGWSDRFKQASAIRRDAEKRGLRSEAMVEGDGKRQKVNEHDRVQARSIDPTTYLESQGFDVKKEGRHLSVRQHGDEIYRVTRKDDGHWIACDKYENGIGDNIALVQEIEPGTRFAESVYKLAGAPSVAKAIRPAPAPVVRQPPVMPVQTPADVKAGRAYLFDRGISLETIEYAEKVGMLRYAQGGVLFVGHDEKRAAQSITRRSIDASEAVQKRDLRDSDKRHPAMLLGAPSAVLVVEGGMDALAAMDMERRKKRPVPTILVSGGANVRAWIETPWVQKILKLAKKIVVAFEREKTPEAQAKTDAAHELQIEKLREVCSGAQVTSWKPPEGVKDLAELNLQQVEQIEEQTRARVRGGYERG
jgi:hypothetical protein